MSQLKKWAKGLYFSIFNRIALSKLQRPSPAALPLTLDTPINIVCRFAVQNGLTNGANYHAIAFERLGYKVRKVDISSAIRNPFKQIDCPKDGIFIFHCAAPEFLQLAWPLRKVLKNQRRIGYFAWELPDPPAGWPVYTGIWDEIWTPSRFAALGLGKLYADPIRVVPHVRMDRGPSPRQWHADQEPLCFLTMADARSGLTRKNPAAVVAAFQKAFSKEDNARLVVKLQGQSTIPEIAQFIESVAGDDRIHLIRETLTRAEIEKIMTDAHVYVSLHRAEGFGLPLLEARIAGLATIATAWSGNMDFMSPENALLVPYQLVTMKDQSGIYGTVTWADPDIDATAKAMRQLYENPRFFDAIAKAGWETCAPDHQQAIYAKALV